MIILSPDQESESVKKLLGKKPEWVFGKLIARGGFAGVHNINHRNGSPAMVVAKVVPLGDYEFQALGVIKPSECSYGKGLHLDGKLVDPDSDSRLLTTKILPFTSERAAHTRLDAVIEGDTPILRSVGNFFFPGRDGSYFACSLVPRNMGATISRVLSERTLSLDEVAGLILTMSTAFNVHRQANVVHRDVTPNNTFYTEGKGFTIFDYNSAVVTGRGELCPCYSALMALDEIRKYLKKNNLGTAIYMSPEQARCCPPSSADDLYSAALTVSATLGVSPYDLVIHTLSIIESHLNQGVMITEATEMHEDLLRGTDSILSDLARSVFSQLICGENPLTAENYIPRTKEIIQDYLVNHPERVCAETVRLMQERNLPSGLVSGVEQRLGPAYLRNLSPLEDWARTQLTN